MASSRPARLPRIVLGEFFRVALGAEAARRRVEHLGVIGAVGLVALLAAVAGKTRDRIVLEEERSRLFGMAGHALSFDRVVLNLRVFGRVRRMTVATHDRSLGNRMVA